MAFAALAFVVGLFLWQSQPACTARYAGAAEGGILAVSAGCPKGLSVAGDGGCTAEGSTVSFDKDGAIHVPSLFMRHLAEGVDDALETVVRKQFRADFRTGVEFSTDSELQPEEKLAFQAIGLLKQAGFTAASMLVPQVMPGSIAGAMGSAQAIVSSAAHVVIPIVALPMGLQKFVQHEQEFAVKWEDMANLAVHLVQKTACLGERLVIRDTDFLSGSRAKRGILKPKVEDVCTGEDVKVSILEQMVRSTNAMIAMFDEVGTIGKCLYPIGDSKSSKMECLELVLPKLRRSNGNMGILYSAITLAASFSQNSDAMLAQEKFGSLVSQIWRARPLEDEGLVAKLLEAGADAAAAPSTCAMLLGAQKAYEASFAHLKEALRVWMRTFGRDIYQIGLRVHPCRSSVLALTDEKKGFCKHHDFPALGSTGHCPNAMSSEVWHEKSQKDKEEDSELVMNSIR